MSNAMPGEPIETCFAALIESAADLIWSVDLDHRLLTFNTALRQTIERNFGLQPKVGMTPGEMLPPEEAGAWSRLYGRVLTAGPFTTERATPDGRIFEMALQPVMRNGLRAGVSVFGRDISVRAESRARDPHAFTSLLVDATPAFLVAFDSDGRVLMMNPALLHALEYTQEEVEGKDYVATFVPESDQAEVRDIYQRVIQEGKHTENENLIVGKSGRKLLVEWRGRPVMGAGGRKSFHVGIGIDITERRRVQDALRTTQERHRMMFDQAPIGIFRSTPEGRLLDFNAKAASMFGYSSPEEILAVVSDIGQQMFVDSAQRLGLIERALATHEFIKAEVEYRRKDNSTFFANLYLRVVRDASGGVQFVEGFVEDITERKRAESYLRGAYLELDQRVRERTAELSAANERLLELDRLKSQFLASMSHELRTPLNSIIGFTSLLRQGLTGPVNAEQVRQLEIVQGSSRHLLALINDLLDVSRIEAGRADLDYEPFDFADVVREVVRTLTPLADRKGLTVSAQGVPVEIGMTGDRKRTLQVLLNLVNNAVKFTEKGSVTIAARVDGTVLEMSVRDTGIGIKAEHLGMLFEAFRQVDGSAKRVYEGTGLGLYLCRKLLDMMGGTIRVESAYGQGSCFICTLPLVLPKSS